MEQLRSLAQPSARFSGDLGQADPLVRAALASADTDLGYIRAIVALCTARLLLPVVAAGDQGGEQDPKRHAELGAVTLHKDGVSYLLAFTGIDAMQAWRPEARPVLCLLDELAATVPEAGAEQLLFDIAGPNPLVLTAETVAELAAGNRLVEFEQGQFGWIRPKPVT